MIAQCPSRGGGKFVEYKGGGKGKGKDGKGKGGGHFYNTKGKGKGKGVSGIEEAWWPQQWSDESWAASQAPPTPPGPPPPWLQAPPGMGISAMTQPANPWDWYGAYALPAGATPARTMSVFSKKKFFPSVEVEVDAEVEMELKLKSLKPPTIFKCIDPNIISTFSTASSSILNTSTLTSLGSIDPRCTRSSFSTSSFLKKRNKIDKYLDSTGHFSLDTFAQMCKKEFLKEEVPLKEGEKLQVYLKGKSISN